LEPRTPHEGRIVTALEDLADQLAAGDQWWYPQAACKGADPRLFFPTQDEPVREAIAVCRACPVRQECADHAIANDEYGIWGGLSRNQRRRIRGQRVKGRRLHEGAA
jgi:WhiB family redox-sensing transcriptional regulator